MHVVQIDYAAIKIRKDAQESAFYPFLNATEAIVVLNMLLHHQSREEAKALAATTTYGHDLLRCFLCK
jgi:hypothetical protein